MPEITGVGNPTGIEAVRLAQRDENTARLNDPASNASQELSLKDRVTLSAEARDAANAERTNAEAELENFQSTPSQNSPAAHISVMA